LVGEGAGWVGGSRGLPLAWPLPLAWSLPLT
jgi:hypothetical protein